MIRTDREKENVMKKVWRLLLVICVIFVGVQCSPVVSRAETRPVEIVISKDVILGQGFDKAVQKVLNEAAQKATEENPYVITIPEGTYQLQHALRLFSNTKLILNGVTLYGAENKNIIHVGAIDVNSGDAGVSGATGYCYQNISIEGGILDGQNRSGTILKVGHASNFAMTNVTLCNVLNAHLMETGGVKGLTIKNCTFENQVSTAKDITYYEAIQLDILYPWHLGGYRAETLNTTDVLIDQCKFLNTPRGVGSHTAILNQPMDHITISNCSFENMGSVAIQGLNWKNASIINNVIQDAPRGIACYLATEKGTGTYLPSVVAQKGETTTELSDEYMEPAKNMNLLIQNNTITTNAKQDPYAFYERVALLVAGANVEQNGATNVDSSGGIPAGDYYYGGVKILDNKINTAGHGIRCMDIRDAMISGNQITGKSAQDATNYHGIQIMTNSKEITVKNNTIRNAVTNGIYVNRNSDVKTIANNSITGSGKYGIDIETATVGAITANVVKNTREKGIFIFNYSSAREIKNNRVDTVSGKEGRGIHVCVSSTAGKIVGNSIRKPGEYGILASTESSIDVVKKNKIKRAAVKAIYATSDSAIFGGDVLFAPRSVLGFGEVNEI